MKSIYSNNIEFSNLPLIYKNPYGNDSAPKKIITENCNQKINFNVMPGKFVNENIKVKEYRIWDNAIESIFDRTYHTDMINSPDHLTFLSSLINLQKMVYVYMNNYLSIKHDDKNKESLKVWPGKLNIDMPKMVLKRENISHLMILKSIVKIKKNRYKVIATTYVNSSIIISGEALVVVL